MQPTPYVPATDFSAEEAANTGGRSTVRTAMVDAELAAVALTTDEIRDNLELIQRDDGQLRDAIVATYHLTAAALLALGMDFNPRGAWATATAYAVSDLVEDGGAYICVVAHTSGSFATDYAAGKWQLLCGSAASLPPGDDATDMASRIQALQDAVLTRETLQFGDGVYRIVASSISELYLGPFTGNLIYRAIALNKSNLTLRGGRFHIISRAGAISADVQPAFSTDKNVTVGTLENLTFDGVEIDVNNDGVTSSNQRGYYLVGVDNVRLLNTVMFSSGNRRGYGAHIQNCRRLQILGHRHTKVTGGLNLRYCNDFVIANAIFYDFSEAIDLDGTSENGVIANCIFRSTSRRNQCIDVNGQVGLKASNITAHTVGNIATIQFKRSTPPTYVEYLAIENWKELTHYDLGDRVIGLVDANVYECSQAGTTAADPALPAIGGPSGTGSGIVDGTVKWDRVDNPFAMTPSRDVTFRGVRGTAIGGAGGSITWIIGVDWTSYTHEGYDPPSNILLEDVQLQDCAVLICYEGRNVTLRDYHVEDSIVQAVELINMTAVGTTVTATTTEPHLFVAGVSVISIYGAVPSAYNATEVTVASTPTTTSFTYVVGGAPGVSPAATMGKYRTGGEGVYAIRMLSFATDDDQLEWSDLTCTLENVSIDGADEGGVKISSARKVTINGLKISGCNATGIKTDADLRISNMGDRGAEASIDGLDLQGDVILNGDATTIAIWAISTAYAKNKIVSNGGKYYRCTLTGTSAGAGGPTGTGAAITDNTCTWEWMEEPFRVTWGSNNRVRGTLTLQGAVHHHIHGDKLEIRAGDIAATGTVNIPILSAVKRRCYVARVMYSTAAVVGADAVNFRALTVWSIQSGAAAAQVASTNTVAGWAAFAEVDGQFAASESGALLNPGDSMYLALTSAVAGKALTGLHIQAEVIYL